MSGVEGSFLRPRPGVAALFFAYALASRVLPYVLHTVFGMELVRAYDVYPWNFSPLYALAIFGGTVLDRRLAFALPVAVYLLGDLLIAALMGFEWGFYADQPFTYAGFLVLAAFGMPLRGRRGAAQVAVVGIGGAVAFFLVSNFGTWLFGGGLARPMTPAGLAQCYVDALPFFRPTLLSVIVFLPILYSPLVLARSPRPALQPA